jgi:hypothetical protein
VPGRGPDDTAPASSLSVQPLMFPENVPLVMLDATLTRLTSWSPIQTRICWLVSSTSAVSSVEKTNGSIFGRELIAPR